MVNRRQLECGQCVSVTIARRRYTNRLSHSQGPVGGNEMMNTNRRLVLSGLWLLGGAGCSQVPVLPQRQQTSTLVTYLFPSPQPESSDHVRSYRITLKTEDGRSCDREIQDDADSTPASRAQAACRALLDSGFNAVVYPESARVIVAPFASVVALDVSGPGLTAERRTLLWNGDLPSVTVANLNSK